MSLSATSTRFFNTFRDDESTISLGSPREKKKCVILCRISKHTSIHRKYSKKSVILHWKCRLYRDHLFIIRSVQHRRQYTDSLLIYWSEIYTTLNDPKTISRCQCSLGIQSTGFIPPVTLLWASWHVRGMLLLCLDSFCSLRPLSMALHRFWSAQHNIAGRKALLVLEWPSSCRSLLWEACLRATIS